jgi:DNA-directed RNA polymerase specialized sigma24 family protein
MPEEWTQVLERCLRRVSVWRIPPNCTYYDWMEEMRAQGAAVGWQALCEFDPAREIPRDAFVYQRIMAGLLTRYRQDWTVALHCTSWEEANPLPTVETLPDMDLYAALALLGEGDRGLLTQLFWQRETEAEIARTRHISQQAVSKRKRTVLKMLRHYLESEQEN